MTFPMAKPQANICRKLLPMHHGRAIMVLLVILGIIHPTVADEPATTRGIIDLKKTERPADAITLVGETEYHLISDGKGPTNWKFEEGILTAPEAWDSLLTKDNFQDFRIHVEFSVNDVKDITDPEKNGNSGIYIQQRYEVQILNSFGVPEADYKDSYGGSIYRLKKPDRLANRPAGEWQTYDIVFRAARFEGDEKTENALITVYQNGELIHDNFSLPRKTGVGEKEGPEPRPIKLQGHHNPVRFRNVWIQKLTLDGKKTEPAPEAAEPPKKKGYTYVIPFDQIPPAPALTPDKALES